MSKESQAATETDGGSEMATSADTGSKPGLIKLSTWVERTFKDKPSMVTARRWARTGAISPKPELHGRDYYVVPTAVHIQTRRLSKQSGVGLLEFVLALTLSLVVVTGVVGFSNVAINSSKIQDEASRLRTLADKLEDSFVASTSNYSSLATNGNTFVVNNIGLQSVFDVSGSTLRGSYAPVSVGSTSDGPGGAANSAYSISYAASSLDTSNCINLVTAAASRFKVVKIGSSVAKSAADAGPDMAIVSNACVLNGQVSFIGYIN